LVGCSLGSTPRALRLTLAAVIAASLLMLFFPEIRKNLLLGGLGTVSIAVLVQNFLLLPWGLNSFTWYVYVRKATRLNPQNATPITGTGDWGVDLHHHKSLALVALFLLAASLCGAARRLGPPYMNGKILLRVFLALFAGTNLVLMLLLTRGSLGLSGFWLTPVVIAVMCWFDGHSLTTTKLGALAATFVVAALLILVFQGVQQVVTIALTWSRRSTADITAFVRQSLPERAVIYGPIDGYLYPVEIAGRAYLYLYEQERQVLPWMPANPNVDAAVPVTQELDDQICTQPAYVIWPIPDPLHQPQEEPMPETLRARLGSKIVELRQPPLARWKETLLEEAGQIGGKYGFPDVAISQLRSLGTCGKR
jgi:hypothetical protein